jgi:hypothetical protein
MFTNSGSEPAKREIWNCVQIGLHCMKGTQAGNFFLLFCGNRNLMVPRACNTRFLIIIFDSAEMFDF